jgi:hypothetical protein
MFATHLGLKEGLTDRIPHIVMEIGKVFLGATDPEDRPYVRRHYHHHNMPKLA